MHGVMGMPAVIGLLVDDDVWAQSTTSCACCLPRIEFEFSWQLLPGNVAVKMHSLMTV